jgi:hypothetical protein
VLFSADPLFLESRGDPHDNMGKDGGNHVAAKEIFSHG